MASNAHGPELSHRQPSLTTSVFVWLMVGIALLHFAVRVPDRFYGIIGAFVVSYTYGARRERAGSDG